MKRFGLLGALVSIAISISGFLPAQASDDAWSDIRQELFGSREIQSIGNGFKMFVEGSANDASIVPISFRIPAPMVDRIERLHVLIDRNPAPVAAVPVFLGNYSCKNILQVH